MFSKRFNTTSNGTQMGKCFEYSHRSLIPRCPSKGLGVPHGMQVVRVQWEGGPWEFSKKTTVSLRDHYGAEQVSAG